MIDFTKGSLLGISVSELIYNTLLDWKIKVSHTTGESFEEKKEAHLKDMKLLIFSDKYIQYSGSIHKLHHDGVNYTDYYFNELKDCINTFCNQLQIKPTKAIIHNLEFGLNLVNPPVDVDQFLESVLRYRSCSFQRMKGRYGKPISGIECGLSQFSIKLYNKKKQYHRIVKDEILRYEVHVNKMDYFKKTQINIHSLDDLLKESTMQALGKNLVNVFAELLIYDYRIIPNMLTPSEKALIQVGKFSQYWEELKQNNSHKHDYLRRKFRDIFRQHLGETIQDKLLKEISHKWQSLLKGKPEVATAPKEPTFHEIDTSSIQSF